MQRPPTGNKTSRQPARMVAAAGRIMGTAIIAGRGAGKTTLESTLVFDSFLKEQPSVALDPLGTLTDALLFRITTFLRHVPPALHSHFWDRLIFADMAGSTGFVCPFPIYHREEGRSLWEIAERFMHVLSLTNPALENSAPISWPEMHRIGTFTGMCLAALGLEVTEAASLLTQTRDWLPQLRDEAARQEDLAPALSFFTDEYLPLSKTEKTRRIGTFLDHMFPLATDPQLRVIFGAKTPGFTWQEVEQKGLTVLLDFRHITSTASKRFALLWVFVSLYAYLKTRGRRQTPFVLTIDEFAALCQQVGDTTNPLATLLDECIQQYLRNSSIWLSVAFQSLYQLDEHLRQTVLSLGTYAFGRISTMREARELSDALYLTDPFRVKHFKRVWARDDPVSYLLPSHRAEKLPFFVLDLDPEFMQLDEQQELFAQRLHNLNLWEFLLRPALGEGEVSRDVYPISIASAVVDPTTGMPQFPDPQLLSALRRGLAAKTGIPVAVIRQEQQERLGKVAFQRPSLPDVQPPRSRHPKGKGTTQHSQLPAGTPPTPPRTNDTPSLPTLSQQQHSLLVYVTDHPGTPVVAVYHALGIGAALGGKLRERLKTLGLIAELELRTGAHRSGRPSICLIPTVAAWELVGTAPPPGRGGALHKQVQALVVNGAMSKGYSAEVEHKLPSGAIVDVHLANGAGLRIACEIAIVSTVEREVSHIRSLLAVGYDQIFTLFGDDQLLIRVEAAIKTHLSRDEQGKVRLLPLRQLASIG